jgi:uncharacterized C2H2 Zn-finger protein
MKCEGCRAHNAKVILVGGKDGDKYILCPRCLKILKELDKEYKEIIKDS